VIGVVLVSSDAADLRLDPQVLLDRPHGGLHARVVGLEHVEFVHPEKGRIHDVIDLEQVLGLRLETQWLCLGIFRRIRRQGIVARNQPANEPPQTAAVQVFPGRVANLLGGAVVQLGLGAIAETDGEIPRRLQRAEHRRHRERVNSPPLLP
jgi:hypothetical protein